MKIEDIDLSATEFWGQPLNYREEAFDLLRTNDPYRYFEIPEQITEMFPQKGFHSLVRPVSYTHLTLPTICSV